MLPTMLGIRTRRNLHIWTQNIFNYTGDAQWSNEQVFFEAPGYLRWPGVVVKPLGGSSAFRSLPALGWPPTSVCFHGRHSECPNVSVVPLICKALVHVLDVPNLNTFVFVIHSGLSLGPSSSHSAIPWTRTHVAREPVLDWVGTLSPNSTTVRATRMPHSDSANIALF